MKRAWKSLANTRRPSLIQRWASWFVDKDNRATLAWLGSLLGVGFVFVYQMTLEVGFTPQINLAEGAFVLFKAAITGLLLFGAIYVGVFAPALSLRVFDVDIDKVRGNGGVKAIKGLIRRCFGAQMFGGLFAAAVVLLGAGTQARHFWLGAVFGLGSILVIVLALLAPRLSHETRLEFYSSIFVAVLFSVASFALFLTVVRVEDDVASWGNVALAWAGLMLVSAVLATAQRTAWLSTAIVALAVLVLLLGAFGQLRWPFRAIANMVGIAQAGTVTLVVPESACPGLRAAFEGIEELPCSGDGAGTLHKAEVLNDWGSRWLVKLTRDGRARTVSFDGNGTIIAIDAPDLAEKPAHRRD